MKNALLYWSPLCELVSQLHCWVRIAPKKGFLPQVGRWGQLLIMPVEGYLEASDGPIPIRDIEWVEISTMLIRGGIAGRPRQMIDVKDGILAGLRETQFSWEIYDSVWSIVGIFEDEPVQVIRIMNPFATIDVATQLKVVN